MDKFLEKQKEVLLKEKARIDAKIKQLQEYPDYGGDQEDQVQELSDFESNLSIEEQLKLLSDKINKALIAIEKGTYGVCAKCKQNIEHGRLEIMPYADTCVKCNSKK